MTNHTYDEFLHHLQQETAKATAFCHTKLVNEHKSEICRLKNSAIYQQLFEQMQSEQFQALVAYFEPLMPQLPSANKNKLLPISADIFANYLAFCVLLLEERRKIARKGDKCLFPAQDIYQCLSLILTDRKAAQNRQQTNL